MPERTGGTARYYWSDPEDRRAMILSGQIWTMGSEAIQQEAAAMVAADPTLVTDSTPEWVLSQPQPEQESDWA